MGAPEPTFAELKRHYRKRLDAASNDEMEFNPAGTRAALRSLVTTVEALLNEKGVEHNAKALVREARAARVVLGTTEEE